MILTKKLHFFLSFHSAFFKQCFHLNVISKEIATKEDCSDVCHYCIIVGKVFSILPFQNHPPITRNPTPTPPPHYFSHTIHVNQQHNVGFFIFNFTLRCVLSNVYFNKIHARQCLKDPLQWTNCLEIQLIMKMKRLFSN